MSLENKDLVSSSSEPGQHKWVLVVGAGNTAVGRDAKVLSGME